MKFDKYIINLKKKNFHKDKEEIYNSFSKNINDINTHFIFFGKKNIGKYSQSLLFVNKYSKNELNYKKKIQIDNSKLIYNIHLSDVHYEIDFEYLTHNSKTVWFTIYETILQSALTEKNKKFIICKNFHKISQELLSIFYNTLNINNKFIFILLCENICFFPKNLIDRCNIIRFTSVEKNKTIIKKDQLLSYHNKNILELIKSDNINYQKLRDLIYDMFIKQYCIYDLIWYLIKELNITNIKTLENINSCCKLYNNNYRPIYHIERLLLLIRQELTNTNKLI
jgi:hypothetical protein